ncbi:hypothetical protein Q5M85_03850 [Paraclostridium bifermentans]|nr:hypothetical protein [Paraclostridium bifermentans]
MNKIVDYSSRLSTINPLVPFEFLIKSNCKLIGQTPGQTNSGKILVELLLRLKEVKNL